MIRKTCLTISLLVGFALILQAQFPPDSLNKKISVPHLKEDFQLLRRKIESSQPGLYLYTPKDSLDTVLNEIENSLSYPMTSLEFFRKIAPLNKILRNLHTRLWPSASYENAMETYLSRFPLDIYWQADEMYVLRNNSSDEHIMPGTVIKSINGERAENIFQIILDHRVRDGFNETYPLAQASRNFSFYYAQLIGTPKTFSLQLQQPGGSIQNIELPGITGTQINESRISRHKRKYSEHSEDWDAWIGDKQRALRLEFKEDIGILTLRTFHVLSIEGGGQDYKEFIKETFRQLLTSKTQHLIIDMRNNHGGHDVVGMMLMSYLHDSTFNYYHRRTSFVKLKGKSRKKGNIYEYIGRNDWVGKVIPQKDIYQGKIYVLMNGYSVSAAGEFIGHLKNIDRAVFIGEEAGGNPVTFTGGQSLAIDLPQTRITGTIPLQLVEMNVRLKNNGHGVIPDYKVKPTIEEVLQEKDVEMEFALGLISEKKHQ
jgi:hypothetical protein